MGYDVEFVQVTVESDEPFPRPARKGTVATAPFEDTAALRQALLGIEGARAGVEDTIDYLGQGLNYARFQVSQDAIRVDNNLNASELLKIYKALCELCPSLLILDLQSGQLHDAASYADWWSRPL